MATQIFAFKGKSMWPLIQEGDRVHIQLYKEPKELSFEMAGQILLYNDGNEWVVHRAFSADGKPFLKGDFNRNIDFLGEKRVWGQVSDIETPNGKIFKAHNLSVLGSWQKLEATFRQKMARGAYYLSLIHI